MDGLELCRRLRSRSEALPIVFLDVARGGVRSRARPRDRRRRLPVQAVLDARADGAGQGAAAPRALGPGEPGAQPGLEPGWPAAERRSATVTQAGDLALDADRYAATWRGRPIRLTVTEFLLLEALARRPGHVKSRDQLLQAAYPHDTDGQRSHHRQPREAAAPQVPGRRRRLRRDRERLRRRLPPAHGRSMSRVRTWAARLARGHTRLAVRLFLFNALLVFLPVAGLWYLDAYEQHLLEQQERAMVQQARLLAAALAEFPDLSAIGGGLGRSGCSIASSSRRTSRLRIVAPDGRVVADSQRVPGLDGREDTGGDERPGAARAARRGGRYRAGAWFGRRWRSLTATRARPPAAEDDPRRRRAASRRPRSIARFAGGYGAATRLSSGGQRSVTLYGAVAGHARRPGRRTSCSSRSRRSGILQRLYDVRLRMFQVVVVSLAVARRLHRRRLADHRAPAAAAARRRRGAGRSPRPARCAPSAARRGATRLASWRARSRS